MLAKPLAAMAGGFSAWFPGRLWAVGAGAGCRSCLRRSLERECGVKKQTHRAAKKVAVYAPRLTIADGQRSSTDLVPGLAQHFDAADNIPITIRVRLSPSVLMLAAKAAKHQKWTIEEIVEDFLLNDYEERGGSKKASGKQGVIPP